MINEKEIIKWANEIKLKEVENHIVITKFEFNGEIMEIIEPKTYYVYKITNLRNGKLYIGQTVDPKARWKYHRNIKDAKNIKLPLYKSIQHHGQKNFKFETFEEYRTLNEVNIAETYWIKFYKTQDRDLGYNIRGGGDNESITEETKKKISIANTGKTRTEEQKRNAAEKSTGRIHTEETKRKIGAHSKLRKMSEENKQKLSEQRMGEKNPRFGKSLSEETKRKMAETRKRNQKIKNNN